MSGRLIAGGLVVFALLFGAVLWWVQTRAYYIEVTGVDAVRVGDRIVPVTDYDGIDAATSPLKMRACFRATGLSGPPASDAEPLNAPGWFDCFDAETIDADLKSGAAIAILAAENEPYGFDRVIAAYPDGRAYQWRRINACGTAVFEGEPAPPGCPPAREGTE